MYGTQQLTTAKYVKSFYKTELRENRRIRNRKALQDFTTFCLGLGGITLGTRLVETMPKWLPYVQEWLAAARVW